MKISWNALNVVKDLHKIKHCSPIFLDEAALKNTEALNRHNCHHWSDVNSHWHRTVDNQHHWSFNVWCGIVKCYVIGPYFLMNTCINLLFRTFEILFTWSTQRCQFRDQVKNVDTIRRSTAATLDADSEDISWWTKPKLMDRRGGPILYPACSLDLT